MVDGISIERTHIKVFAFQKDPQYSLFRVWSGDEPQNRGAGHKGAGTRSGRYCVGNVNRVCGASDFWDLEGGWICRNPWQSLRHCKGASYSVTRRAEDYFDLLTLVIPVYFTIGMKRFYKQSLIKIIVKEIILGLIYSVLLIAVLGGLALLTLFLI